MATTEGPTSRNLRAAARLVGVASLPQNATKAQIAGAIVGALDALARPTAGRAAQQRSPQDQQHYRRERVEYYLALGFTQSAIVEALANETPPMRVNVSTISRDAAAIRKVWIAQALETRNETMAVQIAAWDARLRVLSEAGVHEMEAYRRLRGRSLPEDLVQTMVGLADARGDVAARHIRAAERLHGQIDAIEKQRRDMMGLDAYETQGTFRDALIAKAEELGWPDDAIADIVAEAEQIIKAGLA